MESFRALAAGYAAFLVSFLALDAIWLGTMTGRLYKPSLGEMLRDKPLLAPAGVFYLLYALGVTVLVIAATHPDTSPFRTLAYGALFGLVAYGTYDLSNYATLRAWPLTLTIADMAWGALATGLAATFAAWIARMVG